MSTRFFVVLSLLLSPLAAAQDDAKKPAPAEIKEADVERMNQAMTAGPMHQWLAQLAGEWTVESTFWMVPEAPPTQARGEAELRMILGGRFLEEELRGDFMGAPFEGRGLTGFDNLGKEFQGLWMDNFGTVMITSHGRLEADGKTLTLEADFLDPLSERREKLRMVTRIVDQDHHVFEYWSKAKDQPERKEMESLYTRRPKS